MKKPTIFLSHSSRDKQFVRDLAMRLEQAGVQVWLDEAEINIGDSLTQKIGNAIDRTDFVGAVLSSNSIASEWVQRELQIALQREFSGKKIIVLPILLEPISVPPFLRDKLYADFTTAEHSERGFARLLRAIGALPQTTPDASKERRLIGNLIDFFDDVDEHTHLDIEVAVTKSGKAVIFYNRPLRVRLVRMEYFPADNHLVFLSDSGVRFHTGLPITEGVAKLIQRANQVTLARINDDASQVLSEFTLPLSIYISPSASAIDDQPQS